MPVILRQEAEHCWLDYDVEMEKLLPLLMPYPAQHMRMYEISTKENRTFETCPSSYSPFTREGEKPFTCNKKTNVP